MLLFKKPESYIEQLDRKIAIKESVAMFITGLGASTAYLGYESGVVPTTVAGILILACVPPIAGSAIDDRQARNQYFNEVVNTAQGFCRDISD